MVLADILYFIITLGILVTIHEFGHFWVARRCGVRVLTFSVGFGSALWRRTDRHGTEFVIAALPLGGYVRMLDEREAPVPEAEQHLAFNRKSLAARAAIVAAGPIANFLLAVLVYWWVFVLGVQGLTPQIGQVVESSPAAEAGLESGQMVVEVDGVATASRQAVMRQLLRRVGDTGQIELALRYPDSTLTYQAAIPIERWMADEREVRPRLALGFEFYLPAGPAILDSVVPGREADQAGLLAGDQILAIDGETVSSWGDIAQLISARPGDTVEVLLARQQGSAEQMLVFDVAVEAVEGGDGRVVGRIGVGGKPLQIPDDMIVTERSGPLASVVKGVDHTVDGIVFVVDSLVKLVAGAISPANLSGPIGIAKIASASAQSGFVPYLELLALLSISLGVLNLLPIPVLDGGHLLYIAGEALLGRPLPERVQIAGQQLGLLVILSVTVLALYNDFTRF